MDVPLSISSDRLSARIATLGAELQDLRDAEGRLLQWDGDPAVWAGRAPILFPIVGELAQGRCRIGHSTYAMPRHGFARRSTFEVLSHDDASARLRLVATAASRAMYPFDFRLDVAYAIDDATLSITATIANDGDVAMPASLGFHPAFAWPLPYGRARDEHVVTFERDEPAPIRALDAHGLVVPARRPTPVTGRTLALRDDLFDDDALVFDALASRRVTYGARRDDDAAGPRIAVGFDDFPTLGVWSKPGGARFVCIEPWQGHADPVGFDGDLADKPGMIVIAPGAARSFRLTIALEG